ncbi:MAG: signal peptidase II [Clostridia bacterium]|nr:signal peptidase II [Clostridia bacterium]
MILLIAIIVGIVALDQLTKAFAVIYLEGEASFPLWQDVLHFTYARNEGAAFGMLSDQRWVFMIFSTVAILVLLGVLFFRAPKSRYVQITLAMVAAGGIGNMIDRIALGYVIDFIDFTLIDFAIFNVADSFVTVGAFMLMGYLIWDIIHEAKTEKEKVRAAEQALGVDESNEANEANETSAANEADESTSTPTETDHGNDGME